MGTIIRNGVAYSCIPGPKGETGNPGPANSLSIGSVIKGSTAGATITGTSPNQTLNLVLPKGDVGPSNTLTIGTVTKGDTAAATITGDSPNQTLNLTLPKGDKGDIGPVGPAGASGWTGKNLVDLTPVTNMQYDYIQSATVETVMDNDLGRNVLKLTATGNYPNVMFLLPEWLQNRRGNYAIVTKYKLSVDSGYTAALGGASFNGRNTWELFGKNKGGASPSNAFDEFKRSSSWTYGIAKISKDSAEWDAYNIIRVGASLGYGTHNNNAVLHIADIMVMEITDEEYADNTFMPEIESYNLDVKGREIVNTPSIWSGKNLYPINIISNGTQSGVTFTKNGEILTVSGTATAGIDRGGFIAKSIMPVSKIVSGRQYTLSTSTPLPSGVKAQVLFYTDTSWAADGVVLVGNGSTTSKTATITIPSTATRGRFLFTVPNGTTINWTGTIQLEESSASTSYESYARDNHSKPISNVADPTNAQDAATNRIINSLVPASGATIIPNGANLNSVQYLKVGRYYQSTSNSTTNMTNIPIKNAFYMDVISSLSPDIDNETTSQWVYRIRRFYTLDGDEYIQRASSGGTAGSFTYGPWRKISDDTQRIQDLWTGTIRDTNATATLSQAYTNYKFLAITHYITSNKYGMVTTTISTADIVQTTDTGGVYTWNLGRMQSGSVYSYCDIIFTSATQIKIVGGNKAGWGETPTICRIQGIR